MPHPYLVDLTEAEQGARRNLSHTGNPAARKVARAHGLRRAAAGARDEELAPALHLGLSPVPRTRQRLVDEGFPAALSERPRSGSPPSLTGKQAAFLVALTCSPPPAGRQRWPLQ